MPLLYKAFQSQLPTKSGEYLYYPRLVKAGTIDSTEIAKKVSWATSLTVGDVQNVIHSLTEVMSDHLMNSMSVKLDGFGTFTMMVSAKGNGVKEESDVSSTQIGGLRCKFTPEYTRRQGNGGITRALTENVRYVNIATLGVVAAAGGDNSGDNGGDDGGGGWIDPTA
ncbi:HU family DNA-binding protein [Bacteroides sp. 519]|uniref:HU family DNA-binding protein n=1 Tax=Bacteroides sp. 519 TaxID=2302937 RepID=UPI0013D812D6|nr:HU family DNA-binding protein [Bacteroides sp. 519]NDV58069.1 DNA-binding protein [Bacteroides sp. 519]